MIGYRNGKIEITAFKERRGNRSFYWEYKCDCGNDGIISSAEFNRNRGSVEKSCGCTKPFKSLVGLRFDSFSVESISFKEKHAYYYRCVCDCGRIKDIRGESLSRDKFKKCDCTKSIEWMNRQYDSLFKNISINESGCWLWTGSSDKNGYGIFPNGRIDQRAHRASYKLMIGPINGELWVLHKCDVPGCVNPEHLYLGNVKDNVRDALERGRFPRGTNLKKAKKGSENGNSKLTESDIFEIRKSYNHYTMTAKALAIFYNVSEEHIKRILRRVNWKHI